MPRGIQTRDLQNRSVPSNHPPLTYCITLLVNNFGEETI